MKWTRPPKDSWRRGRGDPPEAYCEQPWSPKVHSVQTSDRFTQSTGEALQWPRDYTFFQFVHTLDYLSVGLEDTTVSFDVFSLNTRVLTVEYLNLPSQQVSEDILALFKHVLSSTYFSIGGKFYEQDDGVVVGSLLSPVIANIFFFEELEDSALAHATHKPLCWLRSVDDTFATWQQ